MSGVRGKTLLFVIMQTNAENCEQDLMLCRQKWLNTYCFSPPGLLFPVKCSLVSGDYRIRLLVPYAVCGGAGTAAV